MIDAGVEGLPASDDVWSSTCVEFFFFSRTLLSAYSALWMDVMA
jgi:hypothetical protein